MLKFLTVLVLTSLLAGCKGGQKTQSQTLESGNPVLTPSASSGETTSQRIAWKTSWNETVKEAKHNAKNILILFTNPEQCPPCRMMEQQTWPNAEVISFINANFIPLMIHTGSSKELNLGNEFMVTGIPTTLVIDIHKKVIAQKVGFSPPELFLKWLQTAGTLQKLEQQVDAESQNATSMLELAEAYMHLERHADASQLLDKVCKLDKNNTAGKKLPALYLLGTIAMANHDFENAQGKFHEVSKLDPKGITDYADDNALQLAVLPANKNDFNSTVTGLNNFLNKFPDSELRPEAFLYLGKAYTLIENNDAAVKTLRKLIAEYPNTQYSQYANRFIQELETK